MPLSSRSNAFHRIFGSTFKFKRWHALMNSGFCNTIEPFMHKPLRQARTKFPNFAFKALLNSSISVLAATVSASFLQRFWFARSRACSRFTSRLCSTSTHLKLCLRCSRKTSVLGSVKKEANKSSSEPPPQPSADRNSRNPSMSELKVAPCINLLMNSAAVAKFCPHQILNFRERRYCAWSISSNVISPDPSMSSTLNNLAALLPS
mmetsp:Transcript_86625/g.279708  ORF Transcript_86625/g.279708 Transcript_86625/m.279708 type:complete len:206 (+) Transcript_86625:1899-2516(+)